MGSSRIAKCLLPCMCAWMRVILGRKGYTRLGRLGSFDNASPAEGEAEKDMIETKKQLPRFYHSGVWCTKRRRSLDTTTAHEIKAKRGKGPKRSSATGQQTPTDVVGEGQEVCGRITRQPHKMKKDKKRSAEEQIRLYDRLRPRASFWKDAPTYVDENATVAQAGRINTGRDQMIRMSRDKLHG